MKPTLNEKIIAYLALFSGLSISAVAAYYSIVGLTAIFAAAVVPIIIMGTVLEISKLVATVWLKQNWKTAPYAIKSYLLAAIFILMVITSLGCFGMLSKAHSDQTLVSSDVIAKIAVYDEKIKTEKENIEANRKALKQMDEGVDQVLGRSTSETGADKAVALRKSQQKERARLQAEILQSQKSIQELNDARAPIAAEVRKVEAEVGPIKYIAAFVYGNTDPTVLEKAVVWVILLLMVVFDPLAVILLLAAQTSFQQFREREQQFGEWTEKDFDELARDAWVADVGEKPTEQELEEVNSPIGTEPVVNDQDPTVVSTGTSTSSVVKEFDIKDHPYLFNVPKSYHPPGIDPVGPLVYPKIETSVEDFKINESVVPVETISQDDYLNASQEKLEESIIRYSNMVRDRKLSMNDVPRVLLEAVKARV